MKRTREVIYEECPVCGSLLVIIGEENGVAYECGNSRGTETWYEYREVCEKCGFECDINDDLEQYQEEPEECILIDPVEDVLPF